MNTLTETVTGELQPQLLVLIRVDRLMYITMYKDHVFHQSFSPPPASLGFEKVPVSFNM